MNRQDRVLEIEGVDAFYGEVQALFGVSLHVLDGEIVAVIGGNASGKSTIIKTVLGLVQPRRGTVRVMGERVDGGTPQVIGLGVGSIPEGRRVFPEMTVWENLQLGAYVRRRENAASLRADLNAALELFPVLAQRRWQAAGTLSGGEQQMLAMARAWVRRPQFMCIDEPSMGLSPLWVERVYDVLAGWKKEKVAILMVEQSANRALEVADRAYVLRTGAIVLEGPAAAIAANPEVRRAYLGGGA